MGDRDIRNAEARFPELAVRRIKHFDVLVVSTTMEEVVMRRKPSLVSIGLVVAFAMGSISAVFAQSPVIQNRVAQQVMIGGLRVDAAYVIASGGGVQSYSCPGPQQYVTPDGTSQGWACFDPITNVWLLSALPPQQQEPPPAPAPIVVQQVIQQPVYTTPVIYQYPVVQPAVIYHARHDRLSMRPQSMRLRFILPLR